MQESARSLGESLKQLAINNPVYTHMTTFSGLQHILDMVNSATKKAADVKTRGKQRVTPHNLPGRQWVGPHVIERRRRAKINGAIEVSASILPLVAISVSEDEIEGAFYNRKKGKVFHLTLDEMGFKQGPTTIFVDNNTASGICNNTIKRQLSRSMNGQYFWLINQVNLNIYRIVWAPGLENLADYFTKHFLAAHHCSIRPYYVQISNSPRTIRKMNRK